MDLEPWDPLDHPARIEVRRQESDDSDAEGGLGNVTRVVLRPPGHSGKAKRGHLCFDASYECGNLGRVDFISEFEYDLFIRPDTCNPRYRLWFNFVVDNVRTDQRVIFNIVNLCKIKTLFRDGMTPLVKTSSRPKWQRLPGKYVYYHKSPEHRNHYILSFAFAFDREEDVYQFAFSFPFSYSRCQAHLDLVEQKELTFFKRETISLSLQNRKLDVITVSNVALASTNPAKKTKLVVIIARSHPGESPTSFIAQGLIDFLVSTHAMMGALRDHVVIKIIPMMNPDGVFLGNYRCSLMGYDLNRHWNQVSPWAHPTLHAIKNFLLELDASKSLELDMVIDMHAHSSLMGAFIYGNSYDDVYRFERHILFPKLLAHNAEDFSPTHTMYNRDASKSGSARRHLCELLKSSVNVYTLEVSFLGYNQTSSNNLITYNEDGYFRLGRNVARTLFEYYRVTGIIPANILTAPGGSGPPETDKKAQRKSRSRSRSQPRTLKSQKSKQGESTVPEKVRGLKAKPAEGKAVKKESSKEEEEKEVNIRRKNSRRSVSQEKAVVELAQLTVERQNESTDESDESINHHQPNKQRYEDNRSQRLAASSTDQHDDQDDRSPKDAARSKKSSKHQPPVRTNSKDSSTPGQDGRLKRKSVEARNQLRARTAAYKTFDFSQIHNVQHAFIGRMSPRYKRYSIGATKRSGLTTGRKVGGGGIVGKKSLGRRQPGESKGWHSEPETDAPCLTIIDFNMLIRKGLDGMAGADGAWRGPRTGQNPNKRPLLSGPPLSLPNNVPGGMGPSSGAGKEGLNSELPLPASFNLRRESRRRASKVERRLSCYGRRLPRPKYVRRSQALLLRGTVTDCSPWEDSEGSSDSSSCSQSPSCPTHNPLSYLSSQLQRAHQSTITKPSHRTPSPISHILLTI